MALKEDVAAALDGDASALERPKSKERSPEQVIAGLSQKQRQALRARAEEIIRAIDELEEAEEEPEAEEES